MPEAKASKARKTTPKKKTVAASFIAALDKAVAKPAKPKARARAIKPTAKKSAAKKKTSALANPAAAATQKLYLIARDPRWLYAHWDFSEAQLQRAAKLAADGEITLRIFKDSASGQLVAESGFKPSTRHWFVPVGRGDTRYVAELGYRRKRGWASLAVSNAVMTPPDDIAPDTSLLFATIPADLPLKEALEQITEEIADDVPFIEAILKNQAAKPQATAPRKGVSVFEPKQKWTAKQARELDRLSGADSIRKRLAGELASLAIAQILSPDSPVVADAIRKLGAPAKKKSVTSPQRF